MRVHCFAFTLLVFLNVVPTRAGEIVVDLPVGQTPTAGVALDRASKQTAQGMVSDQTVRFNDVPANVAYDVQITTREGAVLQGFDTSWYADVDPTDGAKQKLDEEDVKEITSICRDIPSFYSRSDLLDLSGNHARAVALVQLMRDTPFHADKGGEIIWRVELWYFENQAGGWAKVVQSNKVLRRERFRNRAAFDDDAGKIRWRPELGGIKATDAKEPTRVTLTPEKLTPSAGPVSP